ncbi:MAG TPA: AsmA family protein, partial [Burkholderiales bacterium]|nr:AsmA family protein [Burkholderiales bacterium]
MSRALTVLLAVAAVLLIALAFLFNSDGWLRSLVEYQVAARSGRALNIAGEVGVDWSLRPRIHAEQVSLENSSWGSHPKMLEAERIALTINLTDLLKGDLVLPQVDLSRPWVLLEFSADGRRNWILERNQKRSDDPPVIERLTVDSGTFVYRNPAHATDLTVAIATDPSVEEGRQTRVSARGTFRGLKASAEGTGGPVLNLRDKTSPYPLDVRAQLDSTRASAKGAVTGLVALSEVNLSVSLQGANLRQLGSILEIVLPATPKYSVAGQLVRNGRTWKFTEFAGSLGKSDLSGSIEFERESERPMLRADLQSRQLFFDELKRESKEPPRFARLRGFDADVKLAAQMVKREQRSIGGLTAHLRLDHGELKIDPLDFAAASGRVNSSLTLNARNDPPSAHAAVKVSSIQLDSLFPKAKGTLAGSADLAGHGQSFEAMRGSSGGDVQFAISDGEISQLLVSLVGLNATGLFRSLIGERKRIP